MVAYEEISVIRGRVHRRTCHSTRTSLSQALTHAIFPRNSCVIHHHNRYILLLLGFAFLWLSNSNGGGHRARLMEGVARFFSAPGSAIDL